MKRIYFVLGILLLCVLAFTGCSKRENIISTQIPEIEKVEIGGYYNGSVIEKWELDPAHFEDLKAWITQLSLRNKILAEDKTPNNWAGGDSYEFNMNDGELSFTYSDGGTEAYIWYKDEWYEVLNPTAPPIEKNSKIVYDKIPMVMVNGKLYYDTGSESTLNGRCGTMDGEIRSSVKPSQVPTEDNQSNFGAGYGYQYSTDNTIEVYINNKWIVFEHRSGNGNTISIGDKGDDALGIRLSVSNATATGLTLICAQAGGRPTGTLQTGRPYWLEKEANGEWKAIKPLQDLIWTSEAFLINMNEKTEWSLNWSHIYGTLPAGTYRIGKKMMDFRGTGDYDEQAYYAEFKIIN